MVVTFAFATLFSEVTQERTAFPFTCTVQAPHSAAPQPNFVPVSFSSSRMTQRSGVPSSEFADTDLPLRVNLTIEPPTFSVRERFWVERQYGSACDRRCRRERTRYPPAPGSWS